MSTIQTSRLARWALIGSLLAAGGVVWGCTSDGDTTGTTLRTTTGKTSGTTIVSGALTGGVSTSSVTPAPTNPPPTPTPTASASPTATPVPTPVPTPFAIQVTVTIATPSINLAPQGGGAGLYPYTTTVSADVMMSDGTHQNGSFVNWDTSNHAIATVTADGTVTADSTTGGTVTVIGTAKNGQAVGTVNLRVTTLGGAQLTVN